MTRRQSLALLSAAAPPDKPALTTRAFPFDQLPANTKGDTIGRPVLDGLLHDGFPLELHITELGPNLAPHGPHSHPNDELVIVLQGTIRLTVGESDETLLGPGSCAFLRSGDHHGLFNPGPGRARYYIIALGAKR